MSSLPFQLPMRLLGDALDGAVIIDQHSCIRYVNRSMEELTGYTGDELRARSLDILVPPDGGPAHSSKVTQFIVSGRESTVLGHVRQLDILHRTGGRVAVEMKAVDLGTFNGEPYFGAFFADIRQRKQIEARNAELMAMLAEQALSDELTKLPNRRAFEKEAAAAAQRAARSAAPITVGIADVDHFKSINDNYGHAVGDDVLRAVARAITAVARDTDIIARLGGEEFGMLFPHTPVSQASHIAERIRSAVAALRCDVAGVGQIQVTISIGLARLPEHADLDAALHAADVALYAAKGNGRNRVETSRDAS
ncbi:sensor domain-containing diguanylate cyclase [Duganella aquatilis]|nr:sensor domain-containing diguanylate cyclase [Duganella aquatilis]